MMKRFFLLIFYFTLLKASPSWAQVDTGRVQRTAAEFTYFKIDSIDYRFQLDTTLEDFHIYRPFYDNYSYDDLGNVGSAHFPLTLQWKGKTGFDLGFNSYDLYFTGFDDLRFFSAPFPLTRLRYVQGSRGDQILEAGHSQNVGGHVQFGADYMLLNSRGIYQNHRTNLDNLHAYLRLRSTSGRYNLITGFLWKDADNQQNGGIATTEASADIFDEPFPESTVDVNLTTAMSGWSVNHLYLQQTYDLGRAFATVVNDTDTVQLFRPSFRLFNRSWVKKEAYRYHDSELVDTAYPAIFLSQDSTFDHTIATTYASRFGIQYLGQSTDTSSFPFVAGAYLTPEYTRVDQMGRIFRFFDVKVQGDASFYWNQRDIRLSAEADAVVAGSHAGDFNLEGHLTWDMLSWLQLFGSAQQQLVAPAFFYRSYLSNHYYWENEFNKISYSSLAAGVSIPYLTLKISSNLLYNYIYLNENVQPTQHDQVISYLAVEAISDINFGKFHFKNNIVWQQLTKQSALHLPQLVSRHSLYFQDYLFQGVLLAQVGADMRFHSNYFADRFAPALNHFYVQEDVKLEYYPVVDFFINLQVRTAKAFIKLEHLNQGLGFPGGYYKLPFYPAEGRTFTFGLGWDLFF